MIPSGGCGKLRVQKHASGAKAQHIIFAAIAARLKNSRFNEFFASRKPQHFWPAPKKADPSAHHPQTEERLGPRSLRMTAVFILLISASPHWFSLWEPCRGKIGEQEIRVPQQEAKWNP